VRLLSRSERSTTSYPGRVALQLEQWKSVAFDGIVAKKRYTLFLQYPFGFA
jgi:hypothetical protein